MATYRSQELLRAGLEVVNDSLFILEVHSDSGRVDSVFVGTEVLNLGTTRAVMQIRNNATVVVPANTRLTSIKLVDPMRGLEMSKAIDVNFQSNSLYTISDFKLEVYQI